MNSRIRQFRQFRRDKNRLVRIGMREAKRIGVNARIAGIRAYIGPGDVGTAVFQELLELEPLILDALIAAHLYGRRRSVLTAADYMRRHQIGLGPYDTATEFVKRWLDIPEMRLVALRGKYGNEATHVTRRLGMAVENKARIAVAEIVERGMHVREGISHLRTAFTNAGIEAAHPWLIETLVRTQIEVAYGAGRWNANESSEIQEILWGYEYVTAGDDRVRPSHEALEGTTLPKDSPMWDSIWPPNGFCCRCDCNEIFKDETYAEKRPTSIERDGKIYEPIPDRDWDVNYGKVFADMLV